MISPEEQNKKVEVEFRWDPGAVRSGTENISGSGKRDLDDFFDFLRNFREKGHPAIKKTSTEPSLFTL